YPSSQPVYMELVKNGAVTKLMAAGVTLRTAFCGPCFGAGDVPANGALSIRHSTRNFPNREGSKPTQGQISSVALMDARSIAATAANGGKLTPATDLDVKYTDYEYNFDDTVYKNRLYQGFGKADASAELKFGPNIADWPEMTELTDNVLLKMASVIDDPVTTTDELIPSGETSSYRSNPLKLAEFTLSRKDPEYVGKAKAVQADEKARLAGKEADVMAKVREIAPDADINNTSIGSTIFAVKPGDGSAREQAASCQKVLGGFANIANEYATKRYRSNLINWGMLPFITEKSASDFENGDWVFVPGIKAAVEEKKAEIKAYILGKGEITLSLGDLTDDERSIILAGCLINYYKKNK
ncbi:MAG: hydratase, partial [Clostridia bacterium]|nr:hydratase [Clostridia bacterium]